jgi:hypothetical protein
MRIFSLSLMAFLLTTTMAHAICPQPTPKICATFFESDTVFVGKVSKQEYVSDPKLENDSDWIRYTVKVTDIYRGHAKSVEQVLTGNDSGRWSGDVGKTYVFFLSDGKTGSTCGPLDKPEYVQQIARDIEAIRNASSSTIEGQVFSRSGPRGGGNGIPVAGAQLKAIGSGKEYVTVTDKEGKFRISLPPEKYKLNAPAMNPSDYSHGDVQEINLEKGQCAQFELLKD